MSYVPSAEFTPMAAFHGSHISNHARLGPVPSTDAECREWLLAGLAMSIAEIDECDDVKSDSELAESGCDCESCFYYSMYSDESDPADRIVAALQQMSPHGLRVACERIANNRTSYYAITWGSGHRCSDGMMVSEILVDCAPLSDESAKLGTDADGSAVVVPSYVF